MASGLSWTLTTCLSKKPDLLCSSLAVQRAPQAAQPAGSYVLKAQGTSGTQNTALQTLVSAQVQSVTLNGGGAAGGLQLSVAGIGSVPLSSVTQIGQ